MTSDANYGLTLDRFTLYAYDNRDTKDTGIHLKKTANAVLIETDVDGDRVIRYFDDGDGHDNVDAAMTAMKKDANGKCKFNGTVYYVMKDGEATTIIIVDNDPQTSTGVVRPGNNKLDILGLTFDKATGAFTVNIASKSAFTMSGTEYRVEVRQKGYLIASHVNAALSTSIAAGQAWSETVAAVAGHTASGEYTVTVSCVTTSGTVSGVATVTVDVQ